MQHQEEAQSPGQEEEKGSFSAGIHAVASVAMQPQIKFVLPSPVCSPGERGEGTTASCSSIMKKSVVDCNAQPAGDWQFRLML